MRVLGTLSLVCMSVLWAPGLRADALGQLVDYPGAELVDESDDGSAMARLVVLGALEKVNNELVPEKSVNLRGKLAFRTWYLPQARKTDAVAAHYRTQLAGQGELLFSCEGRSCGSSSHWANKVFDQAILYGPEQFQHYLIAWLEEQGGYLALYIAQRATRKIYAYAQWIQVEATGQEARRQGDASVEGILAALRDKGRYVASITGDLTKEELLRLGQAAERLSVPLVLVVHDQPKAGEDLDQTLGRTQRKAAALAAALQTHTEQPVEARGAGSLAPSDVYGKNRVELLAF